MTIAPAQTQIQQKLNEILKKKYDGLKREQASQIIAEAGTTNVRTVPGEAQQYFRHMERLNRSKERYNFSKMDNDVSNDASINNIDSIRCQNS